MQRKNEREGWFRDLNARQRNLVFPDTVQNEGRFWRNIFSGKQSLTAAQTVGILLMCLPLMLILRTYWPEGTAPWWQKLIDGYGIFAILTLGLATFIIIGNRRARRNTPKR